MTSRPRWTIDAIRTARANLSSRISTIMRMSESQLRAEIKSAMGFVPDTTVSFEACKRWLVEVAIDSHFPDSPPTPHIIKEGQPNV